MMITSTPHHRTVLELGCTESRSWCPPLAITSPVGPATLPITGRVRAAHAHPRHRIILIGSGSPRFTMLVSGSHVIQPT
jgi:hypothetical protein